MKLYRDGVFSLLSTRRKNFSTYGTGSVGIDEEEFMTKSREGDILNFLSCIYLYCNRYVPEELGSMNPAQGLVY